MNYLRPPFIQRLTDEKNDFLYIVEAGSRDCLDTIALADFFKNANVYSYECNPDMLQVCRDNLDKNPNKRIHFFEEGLGEKEELLEFFSYVKDNPGASSFLKRIDFSETQESRGFLKINTLENLLNKIPHIDLLCMDTQGFELNIMKGAKEKLSKIRYIILEEPRKNINSEFLTEGLHSKYIGAPSCNDIKLFLETYYFIEIGRTYENELEDNVMYMNFSFQD
jgi:FkbM family methyltransferase